MTFFKVKNCADKPQTKDHMTMRTEI